MRVLAVKKNSEINIKVNSWQLSQPEMLCGEKLTARWPIAFYISVKHTNVYVCVEYTCEEMEALYHAVRRAAIFLLR